MACESGAIRRSVTGAPLWARHHAHTLVGPAGPGRTSATATPRTPARAGCRPPRVQVTPRPGPPRAVRIGYVPPLQTLPAVIPGRSTTTRCAVAGGNPQITKRTTLR